MKFETIDSLYTAMIRATGYDVDKDGIVTVTIKGKTEDITVNTNGTDRVLMLPTYDNLRNPRPETHVFFHPLAENLERGKSEVFDFYHRRMVNKLNSAIAVVGVGLLTLQNNPQLHQTLNKDQIEIMKMISESSEKSPLNWTQIAMYPLLKMGDRMDKWGLNIFVKKKGKFNGEEFKRVGVVSFPAFEFIEGGGQYFKDESKDADRIGRIPDYKTYQQVMTAIFPDIKELEPYNSGVDGSIAPNLTAFLMSVRKIGNRLNYVVDTLGDILATIGVDPKDSRVSIDWIEAFDEDNTQMLSSFLRKIPSLEGNAGRPDFRALAEERGDRKEDRPSARKEDPLPWEDDKPSKRSTSTSRDRDPEPVSTNRYGIKNTWAAKTGGGTFKDLDREREEQYLRERDERDRLRERERERERLEREEEDRRRRERRERDRQDDDEESRRRERQREREREEREARGSDRKEDRDRGDDDRLTENGKLNFAAALRRNPSIARGTRTEEELREERGGRRRRGRDDYDDDRDYDRDRRDRDYDRDRDYRDRRDRDYYDRDRRDRDYYDRDRRDRDYDRDRDYGRDRDYDRGRRRESGRSRLGWGR